MAPSRESGRSRFTLFILLLTAVTLLSLDARNFGPVETLKDGVSAVASPFRSLGDKAFSPIGNAWKSATSDEDLKDENEALRQRVDDLQQAQIANVTAAEELTELREQLGLEGSGGHRTVVAEVTAGSVSNFDPYVLEIDKGTSDGLANGMPVIVAGGLLGKVEDARSGNARVRLISDPGMNVGVLVVGTDEIGIVSGGGTDHPLRVTESIPVTSDIEVGALLVTSGLDRSPYPEGLAVGIVTEVTVDQASLDKQLVVEPSARLDRVSFVTIVIYDPDNPEPVREPPVDDTTEAEPGWGDPPGDDPDGAEPSEGS